MLLQIGMDVNGKTEYISMGYFTPVISAIFFRAVTVFVVVPFIENVRSVFIIRSYAVNVI